MIVSKITGGLGNQMFQYAMARAISLHHGKDFSLDISGFETYSLHAYSLEKFDIQKNYATKKDIPWYERTSSNKYTDFILQKLKLFFCRFNPYHYREVGIIPYSQNIWNLPSDIYLDGYFQSEKYFSKYEAEIRGDFQVIVPPSPQNQQMIEKIKNVNAISLHVRRGDYVKNQTTLSLHGLCDKYYYQKSITYIVGNTENPVFFIFSDDIDWAKENIDTGCEQYFIDFNDASQNHEDIRLMSHCKHHIVANSTFSWWGAWLNPSKEKITIMPSKWFSGYTYDTSDIYPKNSIKI